MTEEKHETKLEAARIDAAHTQEVQQLKRTIQDKSQQSIELKSGIESLQTNMGFEKERVS